MGVVPVAAVAENRTTDTAISVYANYETVSVYGTYAADDNDNLTVSFDYRETPLSSWLPGMPMHKIVSEQRFAAFFFAKPNTSYEVRVTFTDPDGVTGANPVQTAVTARPDSILLGSGRAHYVSPAGDDSNPGTESSPFKTIGKAGSLVAAGDTVYVKAGTYRERVNLIGKSGTASNWITFQAFGEGPAILDGSDPALLVTGQNLWSVYSGSVYQTNLSYTPANYLAIDGLRAYHHPSLASLVTGIAGIPAGWFYSGGVLYVQTKDGSDPDQHVVQAAQQKYGFELGTSHYIRITGFTVNYYGGAAIRLNGNETNIMIEDNTLHNNSFGVRKGGRGGSNYTIQRNTISDTEVSTWPWGKVKKTEHEAAGVELFAMDRGAVVRNNTISGYFDGVHINFWSPALGYNFDSDVYRNTISDCGDDGTELEGSNQTNIRFWENTMTGCFVGMSVVPVLRGPVWLFRNTVYQTKQEGFKVGSSSSGTSVGAVYAYHNTIHAIDDVGNDDDGVQCTDPPSYQNHTYRNNVFYVGRYVLTNEQCDSTGTTYDYDLMYTKDTSRFVKWGDRVWYSTLAAFQRATGQAMHAIQAEPQFENLLNGDLRLASTSPGIDAGTILVGFNDADSPWPYAGSGPEMGAFEVGASIPVNQPPVLAPIGNKALDEGDLLTFTVSASDPEGAPLIYTASNLPPGATFTGLTFSWQPTSAQAGSYPLTFTVSDGELSDAETITMTVHDVPTAVNHPPVLDPIGDRTVSEGILLAFSVTATDPDAGANLTFRASNLPSGATFSNGIFSWTPTFTQAGIYPNVHFEVSDGTFVDSEEVTITVNDVPTPSNSPPVLNPISDQTVAEGALLTVTVSASDPNANPLSLTATGLPPGANFIDHGNGTGTLQWIPSVGQAGSYTVTVRVSDGQASDEQLVTITVTAASIAQTPWQTNAYGTLKTGLTRSVAAGYHFTPQVAGQITQLGGFFNGTKTVKLFNKATGALLATASVTAANTWSYAPISPVTVSAGTTYTVAVYLAGSGGTKRASLSPPLPRTFGDITVKGTTKTSTGTDPNARPTNTVSDKMFGQADVVFVPDLTP